MSDFPFATLCVLSYNRPTFLARMLNSLHESGAPYELIVHDDGSDGFVVSDLLRRRRRGEISTVIENTPGHNQGQGVALNRMFAMAKGDPIVKLDQDLTFRPGWLRVVMDLLGTNFNLQDPLHPGYGREPEIGLLGLLHYWHAPVDSRETRIQQFEGWSSRTHILGSGFAVTRRCWDALGPFEEHSEAFAEDWIFQRRVTESQGFVCGLPDESLCENHGMGPGPSTVVLSERPGDVQPIHKTPFIVRR